jgi:hypothetical protein
MIRIGKIKLWNLNMKYENGIKAVGKELVVYY